MGIAGDDVKPICWTNRKVNVTGIEDHQMPGLRIGSFAGVTMSNNGPLVVILHQYAFAGTGRTIHSSPQLEWFQTLLMSALLLLEVHRQSPPLAGILSPWTSRMDPLYASETPNKVGMAHAPLHDHDIQCGLGSQCHGP